MAKVTQKVVNGLEYITGLFDLRKKMQTDPRYAQLAVIAAQNAGSDCEDADDAISILRSHAEELGEKVVVSDINFVREWVE